MVPPDPLFPDPTVIYTDPPRPEDAIPVPRYISPLLPEVLTPELKIKRPLTPDVPASNVRNNNDPLELTLLDPLVNKTFPPELYDEVPPMMTI
jgi:hypothetical protein